MPFHTIEPVYDENSQILILGSFPSVKSRETGFYYGHRQNRFWRVTAYVCGCAVPESVEGKKTMLLENHIALWDVIRSCDIDGSADSTIKNVIPNDIKFVISKSNVKKIFTNGRTAQKLYGKYLEKETKMPAECLPSTSPANASWSLERLCEYWKIKITMNEKIIVFVQMSENINLTGCLKFFT